MSTTKIDYSDFSVEVNFELPVNEHNYNKDFIALRRGKKSLHISPNEVSLNDVKGLVSGNEELCKKIIDQIGRFSIFDGLRLRRFVDVPLTNNGPTYIALITNKRHVDDKYFLRSYYNETLKEFTKRAHTCFDIREFYVDIFEGYSTDL